MGNIHTMRNFFKSLPDAILRKIAKPWLISIISAAAPSKNVSSGRWTSGIRGGDLQIEILSNELNETTDKKHDLVT